MRALIASLSTDKLVNLLNIEYAPEGTEKQLTPLMLATVLGDAQMAQIFLEKGADPHRMCLRKINTDDNLINGSPLWVAASFGHLEVCRVLLTHGAHVELGLEIGITPLMAACDAGHKEIAAFLVKNGANIGRTDDAGNNALMGASISGRLDVVRFLLSNGARIDERNKYGKTALDFAFKYGHSEIVHFLQAEQKKIARQIRN
ncbi:hypothetical protein niasHT_020652 [Heterodera trifolii]|uniref:Ankyrin repeat domain-containing protein n=1 Tax=Heterodera trifolii TaxID=157864 RepID=A0ABD2JZT1_9BILA